MKKTWVRKSLQVGILTAGFLLVGGAAAHAADNVGAASGNNVDATVAAPISASDNAVAVLGNANTQATGGGATVSPPAGGGSGSANNLGAGSGNHVGLAALIPLKIIGNAIGVGGNAQATGSGGTPAGLPGGSMGASHANNIGAG